mgnify:CR=1 FL=1
MQTTRFILLVTILLIWPYKSARAEHVIISEIMADNEDILQDGHGNYSDWIEIHNPHSINIDLTGFFLTDSRSDLRKWNFPNKTIIGSNEYLIVFASGQEDSSHIDPEGNLHTNFSLKSDGEYLAIIGPDGQEVIQQFSPNYPPTQKNISYGKSGYFLEPSPGNPNGGELVQGFVKDTKFSVDRGIHNEPFDLIISSETEGSRIYYTTDGSVPDPPNGQIYNKPITITNTTVVRAVAYKDNFEPTNVDTHSYIFLDSTLKQPNDGPGLPRSWAGKPADYEMDPEIVNDPNYSNKIVPALRAFPSLSIAIKQDDFYGSKGLYQNPKSQGDGWERSVSVEFIPNNDHEDKFQINSGMRIQGGSSRNPDIPKHSFSLRFRKEYGNAKLKYPLFKDSPFGESAVQEFDYLQLRGGFNFGWTHRHYYQAKHAQYNRDQFANDLYLAMGNTGVHGRWTHLYINGLYWGIYHLHERPDADFMDAYFGAQSKPYDAINSNSATNGTTAAYNKMASLSSNNISSPKKYKELSEHLHVDSLIDYMLLNFYIGNRDWDGHNWRAAGNGPGGEPFRFFPWDSEFALSPNNAGAINSPASLSNALNTDVTNKNGSQRPSGIHQNLKRNAWYRLKFADRIRRHMYNGGPLSPTGAKAIWLRRSEEMDLPIIAESARWGDYRRDVDSGRWNSSQFDLYTRDEHYLKDQKWILNTYFPRRTEVLLSQLRSRGLYPKTEAPDFSQHGGQVPSEFSLEMNNPNAGGTIYYTLDGSDPRISDTEPEENILVPEESPALVLVQSEDGGLGLDWTSVNFDDSQWQSGQTGMGFEKIAGDYQALINFPLSSMLGTNASCMIRIPFNIPDQEALNKIFSLALNMKYDDGYAAFINGEFVAGKNNPETLTWNSRATRSHLDSLALEFESVDISNATSKLRVGKNILAIQAMNSSRSGSDFLIVPQISYGTKSSNGLSPSAIRYNAPVSLSKSGTVKARILEDGTWSALNQAQFIVGIPAKAGNLVISEIHYNPIGPSEENEFIELMNISDQAIQLTGVSFSTGIQYTFEGNATLDPMARTVLNPGDYTGQLDNGGENITLLDANGNIIESFRYNDKSPWPEAPDGNGPSLVRIAPEHRLDPELASSWRPSVQDNGNPGSSDASSFEGNNLREYAFGKDSKIHFEIKDDFLHIHYPRRLSADDIIFTLQSSVNMKDWIGVQTGYDTISSANPGPNKFSSVTMRSKNKIGKERTRFLRILVRTRD